MDFVGVDAESGCCAFKVVVVCESAGCYFAKDDAEGEYVGGEIEFVAEEDFGGHVGVCAAEGETLCLVFVACCDAGCGVGWGCERVRERVGGGRTETKVGNFETTV